VSLIRFEILHPDGRKEVMAVDAERALIGSGAHCDIRLPLDQAASVAVAVEIVGSTVRVETKAFQPPVTVNGLPFDKIPIPPDMPVKIGATRVFIAAGDAAFEGVQVVQQKSTQLSPMMKVLALVGIAGAAYLLLAEDPQSMPPAPTQDADLFLASPAGCPQVAADQARSFAADKFDIAEGKRERSPFAPREGIQAVQMYELARVCFQQGGDAARAGEANANARQLRQSITQDFRARRIRLEHMMAVGDYQLARRDLAVLLALSEGKQGAWVTWLNSVYQTLKQQGGANQ
jgi:hypothetical protein